MHAQPIILSLCCCRYEFIAADGSPEAAASGVNQAAAAAPAAPAPAATPKRKAPSGAAAADGGPASGGPACKRSRAVAALASGGAAVPATVAAAGVGVSTPGNGGAAGAVDVDAMFKLNQANQVWGSWRGAMFCMPPRQHGLFGLMCSLVGAAMAPCAALPSDELATRRICSSFFNSPQKLSKEKEALKRDVSRLERELQQERQERKAAVAAASAAAQAQVSRL